MSVEPAHDYALLDSEAIYTGRVFGLRRDLVQMPGGRAAVREVVEHPGAVAVLALDEADRVVLIRQYRHPVRSYLWELPAGLLDVTAESAHVAAARELAEEVGLAAERWHTLLDLRTSPGFSDEAVRVYLARELSEVDRPDGFVVENEESDLTVERVDLDEAVRWALAGTVENAVSVAGIVAAMASRTAGYGDLRPADAPWPARPDVTP